MSTLPIPLITPWFAVIMEIYHQLGSTVEDFSSLHSWGCLNPGKVLTNNQYWSHILTTLGTVSLSLSTTYNHLLKTHIPSGNFFFYIGVVRLRLLDKVVEMNSTGIPVAIK